VRRRIDLQWRQTAAKLARSAMQGRWKSTRTRRSSAMLSQDRTVGAAGGGGDIKQTSREKQQAAAAVCGCEGNE